MIHFWLEEHRKKSGQDKRETFASPHFTPKIAKDEHFDPPPPLIHLTSTTSQYSTATTLSIGVVIFDSIEPQSALKAKRALKGFFFHTLYPPLPHLHFQDAPIKRNKRRRSRSEAKFKMHNATVLNITCACGHCNGTERTFDYQESSNCCNCNITFNVRISPAVTHDLSDNLRQTRERPSPAFNTAANEREPHALQQQNGRHTEMDES